VTPGLATDCQNQECDQD